MMPGNPLENPGPVYPTGESDGPPPEDNTQITETAGEASPAPNLVEINGSQYTPEQLQELVDGGLRQADYTRKTQAVAQHQREAEAAKAEYQQRLAELEARQEELLNRQQSPESYEDDAVGALRADIKATAKSVTDLRRLIEEREAKNAQELEKIRADENLEAALDRFEGTPFFDRAAMKEAMVENGLGPQHAQIAYNWLYGARVGQRLGEQYAVARGASTPPPMGATQSAVSPGFTHPSEVPGAAGDTSKLSFRDVKRMALEDPEIPT